MTYTATIEKSSPNAKVGISFKSFGGIVEVSKIDTGSIASKSNIKIGDKVLSINGTSTDGLNAKDAAVLIKKSVDTIDIVMASAADEESPLLGGGSGPDVASVNCGWLGGILGVLQIVVLVILYQKFSYGSINEFSEAKYMIFRDIMVMLLLGFGYLMTFLEKYGLGAVGFTMLVTAVNMEVNILVEGILSTGTKLTMDSFINAEFSAAALLISFGALIGRATPLQMVGIGIAEGIFYTLNKILIVFGLLDAVDVGGTITIHMFGAYFGLAASKALGPQEKESAENNSTSRVSDVFSLVGTTLLWVYWPSFVGATETGDHGTEMLCLMNTILSLLGSTCGAFYMSQLMNDGKFNAVHIQNSTLAGGVAVGATAGLALTPGLFFLLGLVAGVISVLGYDYFTPYAEEKLGTFDTCGVANLHGFPSLLGGLVSIFFVLFAGMGFVQAFEQLVAVVLTVIVALVTGYITGFACVITNPVRYLDFADYEDALWWIDVDDA